MGALTARATTDTITASWVMGLCCVAQSVQNRTGRVGIVAANRWLCASVAQLAERLLPKQNVMGSNPTTRS